MRFRITKDGAVVADLDGNQPGRLGDFTFPRGWLAAGGALPDGYTVEAYQIAQPSPPPLDASLLSLTPAQFFFAVDQLAGLTPADPAPDDWLAARIEASEVLPEADRRRALIYIRKASAFDRAHPFIDVLGAVILGATPADLDAAFLAASGL